MPRSAVRKLPEASFLHQLLAYDPATGELTWKAREPVTKADKLFNTRCAGRIAGCLTAGRPDGSNRYRVVGMQVGGRYQQLSAHRIIWKMMTGEEPPERVDHIDGDELNLCWSNLRAATNGENLQNAKLRKDNKSGVKGVRWDHNRRKWIAIISVDRRCIRVGRFDCLGEAAAAIKAKRLELHGAFARFY